MGLRDIPKDPFSGGNVPGLSEFAANVWDMYTALLASGFKEPEALEITIRWMVAMIEKVVK